MNKKVLALAVAGALTAPAVAMAASTVNIYGQARIDYQKLDQGAGLRKPDAFSRYDSYIGFRGEEKLGGGLSAWFQCETTFAATGEESQGEGWCTRNTGVGFRGAFGNIFYGHWDTPYKIVHGSVYRPFSTAGSFGNASLLHNEGGGHVSNGALGFAAGLAGSGAGTQQASFSRRQINTINYHSPRWAGFQIMGQYSATDETTALTTLAAPTSKPRLHSVGATYTAGPLYLGAAYEQHKAYNPAGQAFGLGAGAYSGNGKDRAWEVVAAYTFGPIRVGASYHDKKYEVADPAVAGVLRDLKQTGWALYGNWRIQGPHSLRLGYVKGNDTKGNSTVSINSLMSPMTAAGARVGNTGAELWLIQYAYAFSKRTEINIGFAKLDNEINSRHRLQSLAARNTCQGVPAPAPGVVPPATGCNRDQDAVVLGVRHRF